MIIVVSGLPRSGTSLMMQMLDAAGVEIVSDQIRQADDDNPRGYYEIEKVKKLKEDASWLAEAEGKAIKVISMLLYDLPPTFHYKVIFMERKVDEVLASQQKMLERRGVGEKGPSDDEMKKHFASHLAKLKPWLDSAAHVDIHYCNYNALVEKPAETISAVVDFLGSDLSADDMVGAIDQGLYRQRR